MQPRIFQGRTVDDAIANGLKQLGLASRENADIKIVQEAKKGFLGIGAKHAVIEIVVPELNKDDVSSQLNTQTDVEVAELDNAVPITVEPSVEGLEATEEIANKDNQIAIESEVTHTTTELDETDEISDDILDVEYVAEYLMSVCAEYLAPSNIDVEDLGHQITYNIITDKPGLVIGKHGKIVNSLETLAQVLTHRHVRNRVKVIVNVGDYRERRQETLKRLADRTAESVKYDHTPVFLDPLPASERKIIHNQLARHKHVATHSEGKEPHRYLVIEYKED